MELAVSDLVMTFRPADAHPAKMMDGNRERRKGEGVVDWSNWRGEGGTDRSGNVHRSEITSLHLHATRSREG